VRAGGPGPSAPARRTYTRPRARVNPAVRDVAIRVTEPTTCGGCGAAQSEAEGEGFEPSVDRKADNGFRDEDPWSCFSALGAG
jgi:hypothetical protein